MRGEDMILVNIVNASAGSPPHARGRRKKRLTVGSEARITPACAGKTFVLSTSTASRGDHPRMRGEDFYQLDTQLDWLGSPPHARGRHALKTSFRKDVRITPACAGKTQDPSRPCQY